MIPFHPEPHISTLSRAFRRGEWLLAQKLLRLLSVIVDAQVEAMANGVGFLEADEPDNVVPLPSRTAPPLVRDLDFHDSDASYGADPVHAALSGSDAPEPAPNAPLSGSETTHPQPGPPDAA